MEPTRAVGVAGAVMLHAFMLAVILALTVNATGILAVLGYAVFSIKLILVGVKLYAYILR